MLNGPSENPRNIFEIVTTMICDARSKVFEQVDKLNAYVVDRFNLDTYKDFFPKNVENLFNPTLKQTVSQDLDDNLPGILKQLGSGKLRITFAPVPFDLKGREIDFSKAVDSSISPEFLLKIYSHPERTDGQCYADGWLKPMPLLKLLPEELPRDCSLILDPEKYYQNPEYLDAEMDRIFTNLPKLLKR